MSGQDANPIFFNKTKQTKIGRPEQSLTLLPLRPILSHFYLTPLTPIKVESYMYHP